MLSWNRLPRGIKAIFFAQIINRLGDFAAPFLTLLLTQAIGLSPAAAGVVVTLSTALGLAGSLVAARLGDRGSRRNTLILFLGISALLLVGAGFVPRTWAAAAALTASGFFVGAMRPLLSALVADLAPPDLRRAAFSLSYLGINIGVSAAPALAAWFFGHALNWLFWLDALSTVTALGLLARFVPASNPASPAAEEAPKVGTFRRFLAHPVLARAAVWVFVYDLVYAQFNFTLALDLSKRLGTLEGPVLFGWVWVLNGLTVVAATPAVHHLTRKWTNQASMAAALVLVALGIVPLLGTPGPVWILGSTILWSLGEVFFSTHWGDFVSHHSPAADRGRFQAYLGTAAGLAFTAAPALAGVGAEVWGPGVVWGVGLVMALASAWGFGSLAKGSAPNSVSDNNSI